MLDKANIHLQYSQTEKTSPMGYVEPWTGRKTNAFADTLGIGLQAVHICAYASA